MSFKNIKNDYHQSEIFTRETIDDGAFRVLLLRVLFEINGNLDSMAVAQREIVAIQSENLKLQKDALALMELRQSHEGKR